MVARLGSDYERSVFINCPFDPEYAPIFEAVVFAVHDAGFHPRCARERLDSSEIRLHKIIRLIAGSRFSIHDLSRTELDDATALPRFNMPLELGIDIGCKSFSRAHTRKSLLIFDSQQYRFSTCRTSEDKTFTGTGTTPGQRSCWCATGFEPKRTELGRRAVRRSTRGIPNFDANYQRSVPNCVSTKNTCRLPIFRTRS